MKLEKTTGGFCCVCCKCGHVIGRMGHEDEARWADLDGEAFKAYYCEECAQAQLAITARL